MRTSILKTISLLAVSALSANAAVIYTQDFNSGLPANSALYNGSNPMLPGPSVSPNGGVGDSGVLRLTEAVTGQQGSWILEDINAGVPVTNFVVRYKARVGGGSQPPADGYSFCFGADLPNASWGEEGAGTGIVVSFDTYVNAEVGETNRHVQVKYGGVVVAHRQFDVSSGANFVDMTISLCPNGRVTVIYGTQTIIEAAQTAFTPTVGGRWGFGGRTGGLTDNHWIDDLTIDLSDPAPVSITTQPASQTVSEGQAANFSIALDGICYNSVQWFRDNVAISGANGLSYSFGPVALSDNNAVFRAEVTDGFGTVVSANATLTVLPLPIIFGASSRLNPNGVFVFFNKNVASASALNPANYEILSGGITVTGAVYNASVATNGERSVVMIQTTPAFTGGQTYTVRISNVQDDEGNTLNPNPSSADFLHGAGNFCYDFNSGLPAGNNIYGNARIDSSGGVKNSGALKLTDAALSQSGAFRTAELVPGHPVTRLNASFMFNVNTPFSGNPADGFSFNIANNLPAGTYGVAEDGEGSGLSVSFDNWDSGAPDNAPAIDIKWAGVTVPGGHRAMAKHNFNAYIPMVLDVTPDGLVTLQVNGTNVFQNLPTPFQPIVGARAGIGGRTGGAFEQHAIDDFCLSVFNGGPINFTTALASQTVTEGRPFKLRLNVDGSPPYFIQWFSNDVAVAGANGEVLSGIATTELNGAQYYAVVSNEFSTATSATATITVQEDMEAPVLLSIRANRGLNMVTLVFNEALDPATALDHFNSSIEGLNIISRHLTNNNTTVVFVTEPQVPGTTYNVTISFVDTSTENQIAVTVPVRSWVVSPGFVQTEIYREIYGTVVANLTAASKYPNQPDSSFYTHIVAWHQPQTGNPTRSQDEPWNNYGLRMSGIFTARLSGAHRFYFTHDDEAQLRMSPDANPAGVGALLNHTATGVRNMPYIDVAPNFVDVNLALGQSYYFELLVKEGGGGDYVTLGLREPGNTIGTNGITPVHNIFLSALADPDTAPALSITQAPADATVEAGGRATFSVQTSYTGQNVPYHIWKIDGVAVAGANGATFVTPPATASGTVTVEVHLPGTNVTASANLTVVPDSTGPVITGSVVLSSTSVSVGFNEAIAIDSPASLTDPANFLVNDTPGLVTAVSVINPTSVRLTVSGALSGTTTVRASTALEDAAGNAVAAGDIAGYSAPFTSVPVKPYVDISSSAGPPLPAGTVFTVNNRDFQVTAGGADVWSGGDQFTYIYEQRTGDFDVRVRVDRLDLSVGGGNLWTKAGLNIRETFDGTGGFASRMAWVYPTPTNGAAQFEAAIRPEPGRDVIDVNGGSYGRWGRGMDSAWVRLKRVGKSFTFYNSYDGRNWNPIGLPRVASATPENAIGGLGLGIADAVDFADTLYVGLGVTAHNQAPLPFTTADLAEFGDFSYASSSVTVLQNPQDTVGFVGGTAKFSVSGRVSGAPQHELVVQWQKNGVDIPGAVSTYVDNYTYTAPNLTLDDNGAQYRAKLIVSGAAPVFSAPATITMLGSGDVAPVQLVQARRDPLDANRVILTFNKLLRPSSVTSVANYSIDQGVIVTAAERLGTRKVILTTTGLAPLSNCVSYAISVSGVQDGDGNAMLATDTVIPETAAARVLFITGNAVGRNLSDRVMLDRLDALGYEVTIMSATAANRRGVAAANGFSMIFLSSQGGTTVGSTFRGLAIPTIVARRDLADDYDMVPGNAQTGTIGGQTTINIVGSGHPLTAGFPNGNRLVVNTAQVANRTINWYSNPAPNVTVIAREVVTTNNFRPVILAAESGVPLLNGRSAASRRVAAYLEDNVAQFFNNDANALFDAMINWVGMPAILQQPTRSNTFAYGSSQAICAVAGSHTDATYQWYRNGVLIPGANGARLVFGSVSDADAGNYTVVIGNASGGSITSAVATVTVPRPDLDLVKSMTENQLSWTGGGRLQHATTISGPWRDAPDQSNPQSLSIPSYGVYLDGAQEPPPAGGGTGTGSGVVEVSGNTLTIHVTWSGLSGTFLATHIHGPAGRGTNAPVLYNLGPITTTSAGGTAGTISGTITLTEPRNGYSIAQQLEQLQNGLWYINVHSSTFGGGEIRGQLDRMQFFRVVRP